MGENSASECGKPASEMGRKMASEMGGKPASELGRKTASGTEENDQSLVFVPNV